MSTSSKVVFRLETLQQKALESIDSRISQKQEEVDAFGNEDALQSLINQWRARQEARISELFSRLGGDDLSNEELGNFRVTEMPFFDSYDQRRAVSELRSLQSLRSTIVAKSESLVPDEDGNIALTKTQLREFFGL